MKPATAMPAVSAFLWTFGAVAAAGALTAGRGLLPGTLNPAHIQYLYLGAAGLFLLSRLALLLPTGPIGPRLARWWPDFVLMLAGLGWWLYDRQQQEVILQVAAAYNVGLAVWSALVAGLRGLAGQSAVGVSGSASFPLLLGSVMATVIGGVALALPVCWTGTYPLTEEHGYAVYVLGMHALDAGLSAASALTGTGLTVHQPGRDYTLAGQIVLLVLIEVGALAGLAISAVAGRRLRHLAGWDAPDDDYSPRGQRRHLALVLGLALLIQLIGSLTLYAAAPAQAEAGSADVARQVFRCTFQAVNAFCQAGFHLDDRSLVPMGAPWTVYAILLPMMLLGCLGLPVLIELFRRLMRHQGLGLESLSLHTRLSLLLSPVVIVATAGLLLAIEGSGDWQLRQVRDDTPGRLMLATDTTPTSLLTAATAEQVRRERLATLPDAQRWPAALILGLTARGAGVSPVRLDEASVSPASRCLLVLVMAVGGEIGGSGAGLGLLVVLLLGTTLAFRPALPGSDADPARIEARRLALHIAGAVAVGWIALTVLAVGLLAYREAGSFELCFFQAVSASSNVGLASGFATQLSPQGRGILISTMLLGRVLPLAMLMRALRVPPMPRQPAVVLVSSQYRLPGGER